MQDIIKVIETAAGNAIRDLYQVDIGPGDVLVTPTKKEHQGDYTLVTFPLAKLLKLAPPQIANSLGEQLKSKNDWIENVEVIQGFLNISLKADFWFSALKEMKTNADFWKPHPTHERILVEFASPNTNKPLHLGHIRNILLGWSVSKIYSACGFDVKRVQIVNDRGIAICKSMMAWQKYGEGKTPASEHIKSDHFVGDWYVRFEIEFQKNIKPGSNPQPRKQFSISGRILQ
jgi:arginyl-tRNA synthetase